MREQISDNRHTKIGKKFIPICVQTRTFWGTAQLCVGLNSSDFYLKGHLITLVYSSQIETEKRLQHTFYVYVPGTFESVWQPIIRRVHASIDSGGGLWAFVVNCNLINNNNSSVIKLGMCNVKALCL
jgi:hypothetical protein